MLHDTDEAPRILALATAPSRHDLLLRTTGADAAALAEITSALEFFHRRSDLPALARLAQQRDRLIRRNSALPARLPAVWVHLGQPTRAIELARTISDPVRRVQALAAVAAALHDRGDPERASMIADEAVACSRMITDPRTQAVERCALIATLAAVAGPTAVGALADEIERSADHRSELVEALARVGLYERAEAIARTLGDRNSQARALVCVWTACAHVLAFLGEYELAEAVARTIEDRRRPPALLDIADRAAAGDTRGRAR